MNSLDDEFWMNGQLQEALLLIPQLEGVLGKNDFQIMNETAFESIYTIMAANKASLRYLSLSFWLGDYYCEDETDESVEKLQNATTLANNILRSGPLQNLRVVKLELKPGFELEPLRNLVNVTMMSIDQSSPLEKLLAVLPTSIKVLKLKLLLKFYFLPLQVTVQDLQSQQQLVNLESLEIEKYLFE
ncbi:hypothetical protein HDU76_006084, partial [Blyttiomyces sp. JEL0837]